MKFRVRYRRARVTVEGVRPKKCAACSAMGRIEMHHYFYAYKTKDVRKEPQLALDYTIPLCYQCHKIADMLRHMSRNLERTHKVDIALIKKINKDREDELNGFDKG